MDLINFKSQSVKQLQEYLKSRGVTNSGMRKADLTELCHLAREVGIEVDPDGLLEDRDEVIQEKLTTDSGAVLENPFTINKVTNNLNILPSLGIFDMFNYLSQCTDFTHSNLREYQNLEGYGMAVDGHVLEICCHKYASESQYTVVIAKVKPRTKEKDPISKLSFYRTWILFSLSAEKCCITSAYCTCKGGRDGYCRHVVATLFEIIQFMQDAKTKSVTSGPCLWVFKQRIAENPVLATELQTNLKSAGPTDLPTEEIYNPIRSDSDLPTVADFCKIIQKETPSACILDTQQIRHEFEKDYQAPNVISPMEKAFTFQNITNEHGSYDEYVSYLSYTSKEIGDIEVGTRGQNDNPHWHSMRKGILTASNFKKICTSRNGFNTADVLLSGSGLNEDHLPEHIQFGRLYEDKGRNMFVTAHRFKHRNSVKCSVPGLIIHSEIPYLGASCDGIVDCKTCKKSLVEIKCLSSKKYFYPKVALTMLNICSKNDSGELEMVKSHSYYYQIQGQMLVTGIKRTFLVAYTHKGIHSVEVLFDAQFCEQMKLLLSKFHILLSANHGTC